MMQWRQFTAALTAALSAGLMLCGTMGAAAYSADDVAAKARSSGWPEYLIQEGYNQWNSGNYTQEQLDKAYASVSQYDEQTEELVSASMGIRTPKRSSSADATEAAPAATDAAPSATDAAPSATDAAPSADGTVTEATGEISVAATVTKTDGTVEERIEKSDFINMSLEEKQEYVASLSEESQVTFMETMSVEERNSILKQLPAEDKAALVQNYVNAAADMGMNVVVDKLEGNDVSLTIRNDEGQVIGKTAVGTIVDETGIDHTLPLLSALGAALLAGAGFAVIARRNRA